MQLGPSPAPAAAPPLEQAWSALGAYFGVAEGMTLAVNGGLSVLLIVTAIVASFALSKLMHLLFARLLRRLAKGDPDRRVQAPRAVIALSQIMIWVVAAALLLAVWGVDLLAWAGGPIIAGALRILGILVVAIALWEGANLALEAVFREAATKATTPRRAAQLRSLAPMTRGAARSLIAMFASLIIVSQLGVEIGPLLAGAGIVGIAIGFGAQTLVKDYLTGFSLILEDIVSVGDVVRIGDSGGLVETMTLRTIRLRDFDGTLHVIPYSEAQVVHNLTKTFSYYVFNLPISYESSIDDALALMRDVGADLQSDPRFQADILEPIEVVGVDQLGDSGVVLKARIKTAPIQQWSVGREYNRRIKLAFDHAGIEIPVPHLKLLFADRAFDAVKPS